jgi:hypothetical protein
VTSTAINTSDRFRIGGVFNDIFAVISRNPVLCIGLALLFYALPKFCFTLWYRQAFGYGDFGFSAQEIAATIVGIAGYIVLAAILDVALIRVATEDLAGKRPAARDCLAAAIALLVPATVLELLVNAAFTLGLILLVAPGLFLLVRWSVAMVVLTLERQAVLSSLARSRDLTAGSRWSLLAIWVALLVASFSIRYMLDRLFGPTHGPWSLLVDILAGAIETMVMSIAPAAMYIELRRVKEGASVDELSEIFS